MAKCAECGEFMFFKTYSGLCAACEEKKISGTRIKLRHGRIISSPGDGVPVDAYEEAELPPDTAEDPEE